MATIPHILIAHIFQSISYLGSFHIQFQLSYSPILKYSIFSISDFNKYFSFLKVLIVGFAIFLTLCFRYFIGCVGSLISWQSFAWAFLGKLSFTEKQKIPNDSKDVNLKAQNNLKRQNLLRSMKPKNLLVFLLIRCQAWLRLT